VRDDRAALWHPFTQMKDWQTDPVTVIERASGNYLIDTDGKKYLDGVSSLWANVHGHRVGVIDRAVKEQLGRIAHTTFLGLTHPGAIELSKRLLTIAPKGLSRVFYSDSGAASVEVALKMAFQYWRLLGRKEKKTFLRLKNAYHGDTMGALSVGGIELFHHIFGGLTFKTFEADAPYAYRDSFKGDEAAYAKHMAAKVEAVLKKHHRSICALVWEPLMQGAAGMLKQPAGYGALLRKLTKKYNVLLIADEVATGFGRTGRMFACEHEGVSPDFLCVAKGITGGYLPLSATLATEAVYEVFLGEYADFKAFFHGHTYSANPLACAAALASLDIFEKEKVLEKAQNKITLLNKVLWAIKRLPHVGDIRQAGFMVGIELVKNVKTKEPFPLSEKRGIRAGFAARKKGVFIRPLGNVVVLMPPLSITASEIKTLCRVTRESIEEATR
jgi:adenosylmethionine---8-amino-7-oxononanoate aminotransferase